VQKSGHVPEAHGHDVQRADHQMHRKHNLTGQILAVDVREGVEREHERHVGRGHHANVDGADHVARAEHDTHARRRENRFGPVGNDDAQKPAVIVKFMV